MNKETLDELWKILSSATNINKLHYDEAVVIGSVFGQMRKDIEDKRIPKKENHKTLIHWCDYCKSFDKCKAEWDKKNRGWCHTYQEE